MMNIMNFHYHCTFSASNSFQQSKRNSEDEKIKWLLCEHGLVSQRLPGTYCSIIIYLKTLAVSLVHTTRHATELTDFHVDTFFSTKENILSHWSRGRQSSTSPNNRKGVVAEQTPE